MLQVLFAAELAERYLTTGKIHERIEIVDGIPPDHALVDATVTSTVNNGRVLILTFQPTTEPIVPTKKSILVRTIPHDEEKDRCIQP